MNEPDRTTPEKSTWRPFEEFLREDTRGVLDRPLLDATELLAARTWLFRLADFFNFSSLCSFLGFHYSGTLLAPLYVPLVLLVVFQAVTLWLRRRPAGEANVRRHYAAIMFLESTWILLFVALVSEPIGLIIAFYNVLFVGLGLLSLTPRLALAMLAQTLVGLYVIRLAQAALGLEVGMAPHPVNLIAAAGVGMLYVLAFFSTLFLISLVWRQKARILQAQFDLEASNAQLRAAERARKEFLSSVTHELRTPLVAIHGYADLLRRRDGASQELTVIKNSATRLQRLVDDMLSAADPIHLASRLRLEPVDPVEVVRLELAGLALHASLNKIELRLESTGSRRIRVDRLRFGQVVSNLIENAVKHSPEGGVVRVSIDAGEAVVVRVDDEGPGVEPDRAEHLFEPYYKSIDSGGRGLGLAISRQLTVAMGGRIEVLRAPAGGARFELTFAAMAESPPAPEPKPRTPRRALVLDDEIDVLNLMQAALPQFGYEVDVVQNGTLAFERAMAQDYDLVLLDINVPGLTGVEVSRRLRAAGRCGRILLFSALIHADARRIVAEAQAHGFMPKPFTLETLERVLNEAVPA